MVYHMFNHYEPVVAIMKHDQALLTKDQPLLTNINHY